MDASAILTRIDDDARQAARKTLEDARARAKAMRDASAAAIAKQRADARKRAEGDAVQTEERMHRMADLEDRKEALAAKRLVIDRAFEEALGKMQRLPGPQSRAFLLRQLLQSAQGDEELLLGQSNDGWFTPAFVDEANAALSNIGKPGRLTLGAERVQGTGFALRKGGAQVNCTYEALCDAARHDMEADVAGILFA